MKFHIKPNTIDSHQTSPNPILAVLPFVHRDTRNLKNGKIQDALKTTDPVIVVSDILSASVNSSKSDPMMTAELMLSSGDINYMAEFAPGDHALLWMPNNSDTFSRVVKLAASKQASNDFDSGLKLVGRINSVRQQLNTSPDGKKTFRYIITIKGFYEFTTQIYYNPLLADVTDKTGSSAGAFNFFKNMSKSWEEGAKKGYVKIDFLMNFFVDVFFGSGPSNDWTARGSGLTRSPNNAFLVPNNLCKLLGIKLKEPNAAANKYSDILHSITGVQTYGQVNNEKDIFMPTNKSKSATSNRIKLSTEMQGVMVANPFNFNGVTMWSLLQSYLNPVLNEMYCSIKPIKKTINGKTDWYLFPTFTARQIPLTSNKYTGKIATTKYASLPRWVIDDNYPILNYNLGNSDAVRFNFWQCYMGSAEAEKQPEIMLQAQAATNYEIDSLDIARNGPRNSITSTPAGILNSSQAPTEINKWKQLIVDWNSNLHYMVTGSITVAGIQDPISVGDNLEFDGKLFHIEAVNHTYQVSPSGIKSFFTTLSLSRGMLLDEQYLHTEAKKRADLKGNVHLPGITDEEIYHSGQTIVSDNTKNDSNSFTQQIENALKSPLQEKIDIIKQKFKGIV